MLAYWKRWRQFLVWFQSQRLAGFSAIRPRNPWRQIAAGKRRQRSRRIHWSRASQLLKSRLGDRRREFVFEQVEPRHMMTTGYIISGFAPDSTNQNWQINYQISGSPATTFNVGVYSSPDGGTLETELNSITVPGSSIPTGTYSIAVPPTFTDSPQDNYLLAVIQAPDETIESNVESFAGGVFQDTDGTVQVQDTSGTDTISVAQTSNVTVTFNGTPVSFPAFGVPAIHIRSHSGNDSITANSTVAESIWAFAGSGNDTIVGGAASDYIAAGVGNDVLTGGGGGDTYAFSGSSMLGTDTITDTSGTAALDFSGLGAGANINLGSTAAQTINSLLTLTLSSASGIQNVTGSLYADSISGNSLNNTLTGNGGGDTYSFSGSSSLGSDTINDSSGTATVNFSSLGAAASVNLGTTTAQTVNSSLLTLTLSSASGMQNVTGSAYNDNLTGNSLANTLVGSAGNDTLAGDGGGDTYSFSGSSSFGSDTITDSTGTALLDFSSLGGAASVNLSTTTAQTVNSSLLTLTLSSASGIQNVTGSAYNDNLTGNSLANTLVGGAGNDTLAGGGGGDRYSFSGSASLGSDTITDSSGTATLDFSSLGAGALIDIATTGAQTVATSLLTLNLSSASGIDQVYGSAYNDQITGNLLANTLWGNAGNDYLLEDSLSTTGGAFYGGSGNDAITGYGGSVYISTGSGNDTVNAGCTTNANTSTIAAGQGNDTLNMQSGGAATFLFSGTSMLGNDNINDYTHEGTLDFSQLGGGASINLGSTAAQTVNSSLLTLTLNSTTAIQNVLGSAYADSITGNSLNNTLTGNGGGDTYYFGGSSSLGSDTISDSSGTATLNFSSLGGAAAVNLGATTAQTVNSSLLTLTLSSATGMQNVTGSANNDNLTGNSLANTLVGGAGNDTLAGSGGGDTYSFSGSSSLGNDQITDSSGTAMLDFSSLGGRVNGLSINSTAAQTLNSSLLTLTLSSATGIDQVNGSAYNDVIYGNTLCDTIWGNAGNDIIFEYGLSTAGGSFYGGAGNDAIAGYGGPVYLSAGPGNDNLTGSAGGLASNTTFVAGQGNDTMQIYSAGVGTYQFSGTAALGNDTISDSTGKGILDFSQLGGGVSINLSTTASQTVNSSLLTLTLNSTSGIQNVLGSAYVDSITGNSLNNTFAGNGGSDTYYFSGSSGLGSDTITDSSGTSTLNFSGLGGGANINLGTTSGQTVNSSLLTLTLSSSSGVQNVVGSTHADTIAGNSLSNTLTGDGGGDAYSFAGNSSLGSDTITDTSGTAALDFSSLGGGATINLGTTSPQTVNSSLLTLTLSSASGIQNVTGSTHSDTIAGNSLGNTLTGDGGGDTYSFAGSSSLGSDKITDSSGTSTLDFSQLGGSVNINLGTTTAQTVHSGLLTLTLSSASGIQNAVGSAAGNTITGNSLNNTLTAGPGGDSLTGSGGSDRYVFPGSSSLGSVNVTDSSGTGTLDFSQLGGAVSANLGVTTAQTVNSSLLTLTLSSASGIQNAVGSAFGDTLTGNSLNNTLTAGAGGDLLNRGTGSDTYVFAGSTAFGSVNVNDSSGTATLDFSGLGGGASVNLGTTTAQPINSSLLTLTLSSAAGIQNVKGSAYADSITANSLGNTLTGNGGGDRYVFSGSSSLGSDAISDSSGTATLDFSGLGGSVSVNLGTTTAQTIHSGLLTLTLSSATGIQSAIGSTSGNTITGNSLNNRLVAGAGGDALTGNGGSDTYVFAGTNNLGSATVTDSSGTGTLDFSAIGGGASVNLGTTTAQTVNGSLLTLTLSSATGIQSINGSAYADNLTGNSLNNSLTGNGGGDTYVFGGSSSLGSDTLTDTSGTSTLDFSGLGGAVSVNLDSTAAQIVNSSLLTLALSSASGIQNAIGSAHGDTLTGNTLSNTLTAGAGSDVLTGGGGNDTYVLGGSASLASVSITDSSGTGTVDFSSLGGPANFNLGVTTAQTVNSSLLTLTLSSIGGIQNAIGSAYGNTITGNSLSNTLTATAGGSVLIGNGGGDIYRFAGTTSLGSVGITDSSGTATLDFSNLGGPVSVNLGATTAQTVNSSLLTLTLSSATGIQNAIGSAHGNTITGNSLNNTLTAGAGGDSLTDGSGNDTYIFAGSSDLGSVAITDSSGHGTLDFSNLGGGASVNIGSTSTQVVNGSLLTLTLSSSTGIQNVNGSAFGDNITGNSQNNTLTGNGGGDTYVFSGSSNLGSDTINDGSGTATLDFSSFGGGVSLNLGTVTISQPVNFSLLTLTLNNVDGIENVEGSTHSDAITGDFIANTIWGNGGNDTLTLPAGGAAYGGTGNDVLSSTTGPVYLAAGGGNDTLTSASGPATMVAGAGNDTFTSSSGSTTYEFAGSASLGADTINDSTGLGTLDFSGLGSGVSINLGSTASQTLNTLLTLSLSSASGIENVVGSPQADSITGNSLDNTITGNGGNDSLDGGSGNDDFIFSGSSSLGSVTVNEGTVNGVNSLDFTNLGGPIAVNLATTTAQVVNSSLLTLTLSSAAMIQQVAGTAYNDSITGNSLADTLAGGAGNDTLNSGSGNDTYVFWGLDALGSDTINDSTGTGTLDFLQLGGSATANLGTTAAQVVNPSLLTLTLSSASGMHSVIGSVFNDTLTANTLSDTLAGSAGADTYRFGGSSSLGSATVVDGSGTGTLDFSTLGAGVVVNTGLTSAQVVNSSLLTLTLSSQYGIQNVVGSTYADNITGNLLLTNTLTGNGGNDTLNAGGSSDTYVFGGTSALGSVTINDSSGLGTLDFSHLGGPVSVNLGATGAQTVNSSLLTLTLSSASGIQNVIGSADGDSLTGNSLSNTLHGGEGLQYLAGAGGGDTYAFAGSAPIGIATISDSSGNATLDFSGFGGAVNLNLGSTSAQTVNASLLTLTLSSATGIQNTVASGLGSTITGNSLNNTLTAGPGGDALSDGSGNVTYVFEGTTNLGSVSITDSSGHGTLDFSRMGSGVSVNLGSTVSQTVNALLQLTLSSAAGIQNVVGTTSEDIISGNSLNNTLSGNGGGDTYFFAGSSALGSDTINDVSGSATLDFSQLGAAANVNLALTAPQIVQSTLLTLTLSSANGVQNVNGSAYNDSITGNALSNTLDGNGGNDYLNGETGGDTLNGTSGSQFLSGPATSSFDGATADLVDDSYTNGQFATTGSWTTNTGSGFNQTYVSIPKGTGSNGVEWSFGNLPSGTYQVYATWPASGGNVSSTTFSILDGGSVVSTAAVNQQTAPTGTSVAGTSFSALGGVVTVNSGTLNVTLSDAATGSGNVVADAVYIVQESTNSSDPLVAGVVSSQPIVAPGGTASVTAYMAGTTTAVNFYLDNNNNGMIDSGDTLLSKVTNGPDDAFKLEFKVLAGAGLQTILAQGMNGTNVSGASATTFTIAPLPTGAFPTLFRSTTDTPLGAEAEVGWEGQDANGNINGDVTAGNAAATQAPAPVVLVVNAPSVNEEANNPLEATISNSDSIDTGQQGIGATGGRAEGEVESGSTAEAVPVGYSQPSLSISVIQNSTSQLTTLGANATIAMRAASTIASGPVGPEAQSPTTVGVGPFQTGFTQPGLPPPFGPPPPLTQGDVPPNLNYIIESTSANGTTLPAGTPVTVSGTVIIGGSIAVSGEGGSERYTLTHLKVGDLDLVPDGTLVRFGGDQVLQNGRLAPLTGSFGVQYTFTFTSMVGADIPVTFRSELESTVANIVSYVGQEEGIEEPFSGTGVGQFALWINATVKLPGQ